MDRKHLRQARAAVLTGQAIPTGDRHLDGMQRMSRVGEHTITSRLARRAEDRRDADAVG